MSPDILCGRRMSADAIFRSSFFTVIMTIFNCKETAIDHIIQQINRFVKLFFGNYSVISVKVISPSVFIFSPDEISNVYE